jgi:ElaB/YqjD/DUF883 family membrane-anchored ribosome-binding protein
MQQLLDRLDKLAEDLEELLDASSQLSKDDAAAVAVRLGKVRDEVERLDEDFADAPLTEEKREEMLAAIRRSRVAAEQMVAMLA